MSEAILIGTRGWDHDAWQGWFYPAELPAEWRFCFYSNLLRGVLVPADAWVGATTAAIAQWAQDSDADFRFVLEPPPLASATELAAFLQLTAPIRSQTDGFLLRVASTAPRDLTWLETVLAELAREHPVCVDLPAAWESPTLAALLAAHRAGRCWACAVGDAPTPEGALVVALSAGGTPLELRRTLEALARRPEQGGRAALFFEGPAATEAARAARTLAELMGI